MAEALLYGDYDSRKMEVSVAGYPDKSSTLLAIYNPSNLWVKISFVLGSTTIKTVNIGQVTSYLFTLNATETDLIFQTLPNEEGGALTWRVQTYTTSAYTTQHGVDKDFYGALRFDHSKGEFLPTFEDFNIVAVDKNIEVRDKYNNLLVTSSTDTLIGSSGFNIIKGYSTIRVTVPVAEKMIPKLYATGNAYYISTATAGFDYDPYIAFSDVADAVSAEIGKLITADVAVRAMDSRNIQSNAVDKSATVFCDYTDVAVEPIVLARENQVDAATVLSFTGQLWNKYFGSGTTTPVGVKNELVAEYRYKPLADAWGAQSWTDITASVVVESDGSFNFSDNISGDLGVAGFSTDKSFSIEVRVYDKLSAVIAEGEVNNGIPLLDYYTDTDRQGIAINQKFDPDNSATAQVEGLIDSENIQTGWSKIDGTISSVGTNVIEVPDDQRKKLEIGTRVQVTKTLDPWGYWKFDDPNNLGQDSSGHSYNFDEYGAPGSVPGRFGMALELDGESRLSGPIIGYNFTEPFGVGAWIKTSTSGVSQPIFSLYFMGPEVVRYGITLEITNLGYGSIISYRGTGWTQGTDWQRATGNVDITDGEWHYVVGVWTGSALQIYIDGIMQTRTLWPYGVNQPILDFELRVGYEDGAYYTGLIDDLFFLVDRRLTNSEIYNQYSMNIPLDLKAASNYVITNKGNNTVTVSPVNSLNLTGDIDSIKYSHKYVPLGFPTNKQYCIVEHTAQNVPTSTYTALNFVDKGSNPYNLWVPTLPSRITIQVPGLYWIGGTCTYPAAGFQANHRLMVAQNGNYASPYTSSTYNAVSVSGIINLSEGDYVELLTFQATGTTRTTSNYTMFYVYQV